MGRLTFITVALAAVTAFAQPDPSSRRTLPQGPQVAPVRLQDIPARHVMTITQRTTLGKVPQVAGPLIHQLMAAATGFANGPVVFLYNGSTGEPNQPFELEIAVVVNHNATDVGDCHVKDLPAGNCATLLYSGPVSDIGQAVGALFREISVAGLRPAGALREVYLAWDGPASLNNIIQLQVPVQ